MKDKVYQLELSLLEPSTRRSVEHLSTVLADNFKEFGSSGNIYTKQDVLKLLPEESPRPYEVTDFKTSELSDEVILATYKITFGPDVSLRSSIWRLNDGKWQMVFHQGTKCCINKDI